MVQVQAIPSVDLSRAVQFKKSPYGGLLETPFTWGHATGRLGPVELSTRRLQELSQSRPCRQEGSFFPSCRAVREKRPDPANRARGEVNSTKTRVAPVFDELLAQRRRRSILASAAALAPGDARANAGRAAQPNPGELTAWAWGDAEKRLAAPKTLLLWLLEHAVLVPPAGKRLGQSYREGKAGGDLLIGKGSYRVLMRDVELLARYSGMWASLVRLRGTQFSRHIPRD